MEEQVKQDVRETAIKENTERLQRYRLMAEKIVADHFDYTPASVRRSIHRDGPYGKMLKVFVDAVTAKLQVDDVLTVNWVEVKDGDYRDALNRLVSFNIQLDKEQKIDSDGRKEELLSGLMELASLGRLTPEDLKEMQSIKSMAAVQRLVNQPKTT